MPDRRADRAKPRAIRTISSAKHRDTRDRVATCPDEPRQAATGRDSDRGSCDKIISRAHRASLPNTPEFLTHAARLQAEFARLFLCVCSPQLNTNAARIFRVAYRTNASASPTPTSATSSNRSRAIGD